MDKPESFYERGIEDIDALIDEYNHRDRDNALRELLGVLFNEYYNKVKNLDGVGHETSEDLFQNAVQGFMRSPPKRIDNFRSFIQLFFRKFKYCKIEAIRKNTAKRRTPERNDSSPILEVTATAREHFTALPPAGEVPDPSENNESFLYLLSLEGLKKYDKRAYQIVMLKVEGHTCKEIAEITQVSERTVRRKLEIAKTFLNN
jgi:RNA polymerase sigma factor (sigma-70 family)